MPQNTPRLGLPMGLGPDNASAYLKGTIAGGGLWHALQVLDDAVLQGSVNTLNDVTLTSPNIGAAEWTDAQHTHASAATAGSTLGPGTTLSTPTLQTPAVSGVMTFGGDATLQRTSAGALRVATNLGVGVAPAAWHSARNALQVGGAGAHYGNVGGAGSRLSDNTYLDAAPVSRALVTGTAVLLDLNNAVAGGLAVQNAPSVAAGATQTFTTRLSLAATGTLTLTPDAGQQALSVPSGAALASPGNLFVDPGTNFFVPRGDGAVNNGSSGNKWASVWTTGGVVSGSAAELKEDLTPLDPAAALQAVLNTDPVTFTYTAPAPTAAQYELPDDPEEAEQVLHERLVNAPLMEAARSQAGFVLASPDYATDPLFETGAGQSNAANSAGVLLAALHEIDRRLTAGGL